MMAILAFVLPIAMLVSLILSAIYVGCRLASIADTRRRWPFVVLTLVIVFAIMPVTGMAVGSADPRIGMAYVTLGIAFYLFLNLLMTLSVAHLFERFRKRSSRRLGLSAIALAAAMTAIGAVNANSFTVRDTAIAVRGLRRPLTVMHISDVHIGHHRSADYLARLVRETNRHKPDIVVVTGDLLDSYAALRPGVLDPLKELSVPALYVIGNHEKDLHTPLAMQRVAATGLRILNNQVMEIHGVQFAGLDYMNADENAFNMHPSTNKDTVRSVLPRLGLRRDKPSILLQHGPFGAEYAQAEGVGLVLAGHTHGGQIFPFNFVTPLIFPLNEGLYQLGTTKAFVSPGVGTFMLRARLGTSNELNFLRLTPA